MEIYLVGGAVRDEMLNLPVHDGDWVVVGATPEALLAKGFKPVGQDFPVFLHPETKEEYALARTERKSGKGYTGFTFHAAPDVTIEEDLLRRDLTINAMAKQADGKIIDPYGGQTDIQQKLLRHVSPAFAEDPVRVLRIARFAARYHHLGFKVADETMALMKSMVDNGEVSHLVSERIWKELSRALHERHPLIFIETLRACGALKVIMPELDALFGVPQRAEYHPEIDTGVHTLMSLTQACILSDKTSVRFAALVHDLGKGTTPKEMLPRHHDHEQRSIPLVKSLCDRLSAPNDCKSLALIVAEYHTHCHRALELTAKSIVKLFARCDAFRRPERFSDFLLCCEADARGRTGFEKRDYPQSKLLALALTACEKISNKVFIDQGYEGKQLGERIHKERIKVVNDIKAKFSHAINGA